MTNLTPLPVAKMRKLVFAFTLVTCWLMSFNANAVVTVTNPGNMTPPLAATYVSLASAINALNTRTAITGPVVITQSGNQTAPAGGYVITAIPSGASAINSITIQGVNSTITALSPQPTEQDNDAIFKLVGADYITIQNFTMRENPANLIYSVPYNRTEFGVALFYASPTNGAQHNTIQNNIISLDKEHNHSAGIYSNTRHSSTSMNAIEEATSASGANSGNKVYGNAISNVNFGIAFVGSGLMIEAIDDSNDIGGTSLSTGNTITNWGYTYWASVLMYNNEPTCIYLNQQKNENVSFNTITSAVLNTTIVIGIGKRYSVAIPSDTFTSSINNNTIQLTLSKPGYIFAIANEGLGSVTGATFNINNNTIQNCTINVTDTTTNIAGLTCITSFLTQGTLNITGNLLINNSIVCPNTPPGYLYGITSNFGAGTLNITNNTITGLSSNPGNVVGIKPNSANANANISISNNIITGLSSSKGVNGIEVNGGLNNNIFKNKICDLSSSDSLSNVNGIITYRVTTNTIYDNLIGDLRAPAAIYDSSIAGMRITGNSIPGSSTANVYFNTVYLNASGTGASFGSSALSADISIALTLRNNIFYNASGANGTGKAAAYRRSGVSLTSYNLSSNNNLLFGSTIFTDSTNTDTTLTAFKARVSPRDSASVTENLISSPTFLNTTCGATDFLHINPNVSSQIESGGTPIAGIATDYDGNTRNATTPDIGADEYTGCYITANINPSAPVICNGQSSVLTANAAGSVSWLWSTGATTQSINVSPSSTTTYTVTASNGNGCTVSASVTTTVNANPSPSINGSTSFCLGSSTILDAGAFTSYTWSTGATTQTISVSSAGTYTVTVMNGSGCAGTTSVSTTVNTNPTPSISGSTSFCTGSSTLLNAGSYTSYNWSTGATTQTISANTAGTFTVTVTNASGCTGTASVTTSINPNLTPTISGNASFCTGSSTILDAGAYSSYAWSTGATTQTISVSTAGTFTVTVTNASGCTGSAVKAIAINANPTPSISGSISFCAGSSTILNAGSYSSYNWSTGATTQTISVNTAGVFTVTVTNAGGCTGTASVTTSVNVNPNPSISDNTSFCSGSSTTLDVSPYSSYNWSTGATTQSISVNTAGGFTVTVTNANGCTGSTSVSTTVNANPTPSISGSTSFCSGSSTVLNAGAYSSYNWSTGATTQTISANTAGTFTVTVTNSNGCTGSSSVNTSVISSLNWYLDADNDGHSVSGPVGACSSPGAGYNTTATQSGDCNDNDNTKWQSASLYIDNDGDGYDNGTATVCYGATVPTGYAATTLGSDCNDNNPNIHPGAVEIQGNGIDENCNGMTDDCPPFSFTISGNNSFCAGSSTILNAGSYSSYIWSTGATTQTISVNTAGTFTVTVMNGNGCTSSSSFTTTVNASPAPSISGGSSFCAGGSTILNAGTGYNSYNWSIGATTQTISASTAGTFTVTVSNIFGCTASASKTVIISVQPVPSISGGNSFCAPGSVSLNAGAGYSSYAWSTGVTTQSINVSSVGTYTVTVTNAGGCSGSANKVIIGNASPAQPGTVTGATTICKNSNETYSIIPVPGATSYTWTATSGAAVSSGQGSATVVVNFSNAAASASISVVAVNACGNSAARTLAYTVTSALPSQPIALSGQLYGVCNQNNVPYNCPATVNASSYQWTVPAGVTLLSGQGTNAITVKYTSSFAGTGTISVAAISGCGSSATLSRTVNSKPQQPVVSGQNWACAGQAGLTYSVTPVAGATSYTWTVVAGSIIVSGQGTTSITVNWGGINGQIKCVVNNGCGSSIPASLAVSFTCKEATDDEYFSELSLYPNPASTSATIEFEGYKEGKAQLTVYDLIGKQLMNKDFEVETGVNLYKLYLANCPKGTYTIRVIYNGVIRYKKLIIQ